MNGRQHTDRQYEADLRELNGRILEMGGLVEQQIRSAVSALVDRDDELARQTIELDHRVNRMDVEIDETCLRLLALHQPAARDLRLITTALKITTDLERIGDMAVNLCERALELNQEPPLKPFVDIPRMAEIAQGMLRESLDSFVREDVDLALRVCREDDETDEIMNKVFSDLLAHMAGDASSISRAIRVTFVAKYIERIADHATNIAEMVVFMVKGKSIRHMEKVPGSL